MKCPKCENDLKPVNHDGTILRCCDCGNFYTKPWVIGFWHGYMKAKETMRNKSNAEEDTLGLFP